MADLQAALENSQSLRKAGNTAESERSYQGLRLAAQESGNRSMEMAALLGVAATQLAQGNFQAAQTYAWAVLGFANHAGDTGNLADPMAHAYGLLGSAYLSLNRGNEARSCLTKALHLAQGAGPEQSKHIFQDLRIAHLLSELLRQNPQQFQVLAGEIDLVAMGLA